MRRMLKCMAGLCLALALPLHAAGPAPLDACKLLPESVIAEVQGSKPTATQPTSHDDGNLSSSQCFFTLSPFSKSVSLQVLSHAADDRIEVRQFWNERFHKPAAEAAEKEPEEESGERESSPPQPVRGLGEEAYWVSNGRGGALYVLHQGYVLRVSVGGNDLATEKQNATELARAVVEDWKER